MEKMKLKFPNNDEHEFEYGKPLVIIGANGAGKTRFSVKIEELNDPSFKMQNQLSNSHVHRLSAQKSLTIEDSISIHDYESSERSLYLGDSYIHATKNGHRYNSNPATHLLSDYQNVLSLLFAEENKELQVEHKHAKEFEKQGKALESPSDTVVDRAERIWNTILPHRTIDLSGNGVHVNYNGQQYHGKEMSDGERVMLYMICQALVVKSNTLLIIDEPELHIHKAVVNELWSLLENERPDCIFMYLTHDLDFALSRNNAQYLWIKNYDGTNWEYEFLDIDNYPELPSDLLLEILGTRQKIVFVEGTKDSYDYKLYQEIYRDKGYHVIPCGGCQDVIRLVKAKKTYEKLQAINVYGIVDRDFRPEREIEALKADGIYTLSIAEVENLFIVPKILEIMENQLGCDDGAAEAAKKRISDIFSENKENQINEALSKEVSHQLSLFELGKKSYSNDDIQKLIAEKFTAENIHVWREEKESIFTVGPSIDEILKVFNFKPLAKCIGSVFHLSDNDFPKRVINCIAKNKEVGKEILDALSQYVPELP